MKEKKGEHPFGDAGQVIALVTFFLVWAADSFFLRRSTLLSETIPLVVRLAFLAIALAIAVYLFKSGHMAVRHDERPAGILTTGAFRYVRHPLYLAGMLTYLGLAVSTASLLSLMVLIGIVFFYNFIAGYEEKLMEMKFGEDYRIYKEKTGRWIPKT